MKNSILIFIFIIASIPVFSQNLVPTDAILITGKVKKEKVFTISDLRKFKSVLLGDINISCAPKQKKISKSVKAIFVKDLLDSIRFDYSSSKMLNIFYFKFEGSDGYKVIYSFNEIYNTDTGKNLYIVIEKDGVDINDMDNRILVLTTSDLKSGNRNIKNLSKIVVCMAE